MKGVVGSGDRCERGGCDKPAKARGLCVAHYERERHRHRSRPDRLIANRARSRAVGLLIRLHSDDFRSLLASCTAAVEEEVRQHREAMPDAPDNVPRLRPGPRPADEEPEDRVQVVQRPSETTNCPRCRFLHAINHECPNCSLSARKPRVIAPKPQQSSRERVRSMLLAGKKPTWIIDQGESRSVVLAVCAELRQDGAA